MEDECLSLTWTNHAATYRHMLNNLRLQNVLTDVTISCKGENFHVHKLVLVTCSEYFETLLTDLPCQHPIIYLRDICRKDVKALIDFMYVGETDVPQKDVPNLLATAEALKIKGLGMLPEEVSNNANVQSCIPANVESSDDVVSLHKLSHMSHTQHNSDSGFSPSYRPLFLESHPVPVVESKFNVNDKFSYMPPLNYSTYDSRKNETESSSHLSLYDSKGHNVSLQREDINLPCTSSMDLNESKCFSIYTPASVSSRPASMNIKEVSPLSPLSNLPLQKFCPSKHSNYVHVDLDSDYKGKQTMKTNHDFKDTCRKNYDEINFQPKIEVSENLHEPNPRILNQQSYISSPKECSTELNKSNLAKITESSQYIDHLQSMQDALIQDENSENGRPAKPFVCPVCFKRFAKAAIRKRHHLAHFRPYGCHLCTRTFTRREVLSEHILEHNGADLRLPCPVCHMTIKRKRNLQAHIKVKHPEYHQKMKEPS